jgi:hypothetical protein
VARTRAAFDRANQAAREAFILELGRRCWRPMRMLGVHYRSRHQSLIAYSNREFYDDRLLVYPKAIAFEYGRVCREVPTTRRLGSTKGTVGSDHLNRPAFFKQCRLLALIAPEDSPCLTTINCSRTFSLNWAGVNRPGVPTPIGELSY